MDKFDKFTELFKKDLQHQLAGDELEKELLEAKTTKDLFKIAYKYFEEDSDYVVSFAVSVLGDMYDIPEEYIYTDPSR